MPIEEVKTTFDKAIELFAEIEWELGRELCRPPSILVDLCGHLIIAEVIDDHPALNIYTTEEVVNWYCEMRELVENEDDPDYTLIDAYQDAMPAGKANYGH